jgi:hypothetical protein
MVHRSNSPLSHMSKICHISPVSYTSITNIIHDFDSVTVVRMHIASRHWEFQTMVSSSLLACIVRWYIGIISIVLYYGVAPNSMQHCYDPLRALTLQGHHGTMEGRDVGSNSPSVAGKMGTFNGPGIFAITGDPPPPPPRLSTEVLPLVKPVVDETATLGSPCSVIIKTLAIAMFWLRRSLLLERSCPFVGRGGESGNNVFGSGSIAAAGAGGGHGAAKHRPRRNLLGPQPPTKLLDIGMALPGKRRSWIGCSEGEASSRLTFWKAGHGLGVRCKLVRSLLLYS